MKLITGTTLKSNTVIVRGHKDKVEECKSKLEMDCKVCKLFDLSASDWPVAVIRSFYRLV